MSEPRNGTIYFHVQIVRKDGCLRDFVTPLSVDSETYSFSKNETAIRKVVQANWPGAALKKFSPVGRIYTTRGEVK